MGDKDMLVGYDSVNEIEIHSWDELLSHARPRRVFRGQENADWALKTTLERACERIDADIILADKRECSLLREFRRRFHQYSQHEPEADDHLEWLSIMQHYGAPTRLLDWTYSLPVAAHFALCKASAPQSAAIWYLDQDWCATEGEHAVKGVGKKPGYVTMKGRVEEYPKSEFYRIFVEPPNWDGIALVNPFRLDVRLRNQQGVLAAVGNVRKSFMENVQSFSGWKSHATKLIIDPSLFIDFLKKLQGINITSSLLFPGLEGFAVGLGVYHPVLWSK